MSTKRGTKWLPRAVAKIFIIINFDAECTWKFHYQQYKFIIFLRGGGKYSTIYVDENFHGHNFDHARGFRLFPQPFFNFAHLINSLTLAERKKSIWKMNMWKRIVKWFRKFEKSNYEQWKETSEFDVDSISHQRAFKRIQ